VTLAVLTRQFDALPVEEQLDYVQALWERISLRPETLPVPDWHLAIVRERARAHTAGSEESVSWSELRADLLDE